MGVGRAVGKGEVVWREGPRSASGAEWGGGGRGEGRSCGGAGEMLRAEEFGKRIDRGACDILHPDVLFCGGMHELKKIADYGDLHNLPLAIHGNGGALATIAAAHVAAACRNFLGLEYHFIETPWIGAFVSRDVPLFRKGHVPLTDAPGLGVELNAEVCRKYLAPGESLFE